jgi:KaiC/GvpD/RAD55 family RecA-like ATPase
MELTFMTYNEFKISAIMEDFDPVIENFLSRKEFMLIHATAKTGKSMLALNLAIAVASGSDFLGMPTTKSKVFYLQTEIANYALKERIDRMLEDRDIETSTNAELNLFIASDRIRIDTPEGIDLLRRQIEKTEPKLLIIDPLYDLHRKNEDSATEMSPLLSDIREIARSLDCAIILIHHQGKKSETSNNNAGHACRGSSAFADVPDISISLTRAKEGYNLKGIFRNRVSIDDLSLKFDTESLRFELAGHVQRPTKTKDLIYNALLASQDGLTKKELHKLLSHISISALQKQLENLRDSGQLMIEGQFKNSLYKLSPKAREETFLLKENKFLS